MKTNLITMLQFWPQNLKVEENQAIANAFFKRQSQVNAVFIFTISMFIFGSLISRRYPLTGASMTVLGLNGAAISRDCLIILENIKNIYSNNYQKHLNYSNLSFWHKITHQPLESTTLYSDDILQGTLVLQPFMQSAVQKMIEHQKTSTQTVSELILAKFAESISTSEKNPCDNGEESKVE